MRPFEAMRLMIVDEFILTLRHISIIFEVLLKSPLGSLLLSSKKSRDYLENTKKAAAESKHMAAQVKP